MVLILPAEDLGLVGFPGCVDMDTQPASPAVTICFDAGCQSRTERSIIDPVYDRSFNRAPGSFHDLLLLVYPLSARGMGRVKLFRQSLTITAIPPNLADLRSCGGDTLAMK